jgi:hypothetical protein
MKRYPLDLTPAIKLGNEWIDYLQNASRGPRRDYLQCVHVASLFDRLDL